MSVVGKGPCPACRRLGRDTRGDNLVRYSNGGAHCFSCQYYERATKMESPLLIAAGDTRTPPSDLVYVLPAANVTYLKSYGLTDQEIANNFRYSPKWDRHVYVCPALPLYQMTGGNGLFYESRSLDPRYTKTIQHGTKPYKIKGNVESSGALVIVEDIISAIKLERQYGVLCLHGSFMPADILSRLCRFTNISYLIWWLDNDKYAAAAQYCEKAMALNMYGATILTEKDPKCYTDTEISNEVDEAVNFVVDMM